MAEKGTDSLAWLSVKTSMPVGVCDRADHPAWIADGDTIIRNVSVHNAPASDDNIASDRDAREYLDTCTEPDIIADGDRIGVFQSLIAAVTVDGMSCSVESAVWRDKNIISEGDFGAIQNDEIVVGEKVFTDLNLGTVIAPKRCDDAE